MYSNVPLTEYCTEFVRVTMEGDEVVGHNKQSNPLLIQEWVTML